VLIHSCVDIDIYVEFIQVVLTLGFACFPQESAVETDFYFAAVFQFDWPFNKLIHLFPSFLLYSKVIVFFKVIRFLFINGIFVKNIISLFVCINRFNFRIIIGLFVPIVI